MADEAIKEMTSRRDVVKPSNVLFLCTGNSARSIIADVFRMLNNRISIFTELPFDSLDRLSLQKRLDEIGRNR